MLQGPYILEIPRMREKVLWFLDVLGLGRRSSSVYDVTNEKLTGKLRATLFALLWTFGSIYAR